MKSTTKSHLLTIKVKNFPLEASQNHVSCVPLVYSKHSYLLRDRQYFQLSVEVIKLYLKYMQIMKVQMRVPLGLWTCSRLIKTYLEAAGEQTFYETVTVAEE